MTTHKERVAGILTAALGAFVVATTAVGVSVMWMASVIVDKGKALLRVGGCRLGGRAFTVIGFLVLLASPVVRAAGQPALVQQVTALDDDAAVAYTEGDFARMKKQLVKALSLGKDALGTQPMMQPIMARVYLHLGVLYVDGLENRAVGLKYFVKALKIRPDIEVRPNMATKTVKSVFAEAHRQEASAEETPTGKESAAVGRTAAVAHRDDADGRPVEAERRPVKAAAASERCRGDAEIADVKRQAREEFDRLEKALSMSKDALTKERADSEKFRKDKMALERALAEAKQRVTQLEEEARQKDKQASASTQREKKEHDAREALEKEKTEQDSLILETAQRVQQLEKESAEKDKQLAAAAQREKKDREALGKLERDRQVADAHDRARREWEDRIRAERDKIEAVPPLPSRIPEPLHCAIPEEIRGGADLFVQCVAQPAIKAKTIVFYYRPSSATIYNALVMDPTKRGWSRAVITANKLNDKLLQYYAEARDSRDSVAATNGKASSPNIVTIAPPGKP